MNKQLSKSESKYRYKFFYENHLNKFAQKNIDKLITEWGVTYKGIYRGCNKIKKRIELVAKALQQLFQLNIIKSVCEKAVD